VEESLQKVLKVDIACPICKKKGEVNVPKNILKEHGLTTISIPSNSLCEHNFQVFLDQHHNVRGYQKVDFEITSISTNSTAFNCLMCGAEVIFNIHDEKSFLKKKVNEKFFGKETCSYEIAHYFKDELHINNVIVDNNGQLQDFLNTYKIKLQNYTNSEEKTQKYYKLSNEGQNPVETHPIFNIFLIFNKFNNWIFELVSPPHINVMELINLLDTKIQETNKVYSTTPEYMNTLIAEKNFHIWNSGDSFIIIDLKDEQEFQWMKKVMTNMNHILNTDAHLISRSPRILLIPEFLNHSNITEKQEPLVERLIFDDLLYSKIEIKYKERIPQINEKICSRISIDQDFLASFFNTNLNTIEFLRTHKSTDSLEIILKVIDFVNRRNLIM
jgi:hypothetical protein